MDWEEQWYSGAMYVGIFRSFIFFGLIMFFHMCWCLIGGLVGSQVGSIV